MSEHLPRPEEEFIAGHLREAFDEAGERIAPWYLGDEAETFREHLELEFITTTEPGHEIPTVRFDGQTDKMYLRVRPDTILFYANHLADDTELEVNDVTRCLIGAGVARCVVGWKILPLRMAEKSGQKRQELQEMLCDKEPLLSHAEEFDRLNGTQLSRGIQRLGDAKMTDLNVLRFSVGASLNHMSDVIGWPPKWQTVVEKELVRRENKRNLDLRSALAVFEAESAWKFYDDQFSELLVALNFPMTPAEELSSFAFKQL